MNKIQELIKDFEGKNVVMIQDGDNILFELYSTGSALGYARDITSKGKIYENVIRKDRIDKIVKNGLISTLSHDGKTYLDEENLYDFMFEAKSGKCKEFRKWVVKEVLPSIRKNDFYVDENISKESYDKLMKKVKDLGKRNKWLMDCFGNKLSHIKNVAKELDIDIEYIMEYMIKCNWIGVNGNVLSEGAFGKVILDNDNYYISRRGFDLISSSISRKKTKEKGDRLFESKGENIFEGK